MIQLTNFSRRRPGISEAMQARVFDPFFRLDGVRNRDTGNAGIDLRLSRDIAGAAGGDMSLRNAPECGPQTQFVVSR